MSYSVKLGTSLVALGTALWSIGEEEAPPPAPPEGRTWQTLNSYKGAFGLEYTNFLLSMPNPVQDVRNGSSGVLYDGSILEDQGHINRDGMLVSMPADAEINAAWLYARLNVNVSGLRDAPGIYNDRVIVFKVTGGTIGAGNALGFQNYGSSPINVIDDTPTSYRVELTITDVANWVGEFILRINFGGTTGQQSRLDALAALSNVTLAAFFKDEEALFDDIANNPWKAWSPAMRSRLDHFDILRPMDQMGNHVNNITHIKDFNRVSDPHWAGGVGGYATGGILSASTHSRRHGHSPEAFLNLCEYGSPSGNAWTAYINMPLWMNSPIRKVCHTFFFVQGASYYEDGVSQSFAADDNLFWFDPSWVDLSSLTVITGPTKGAVDSVDTTTGRVIYNPHGGTPHDHTSGEVDELITFQYNRIDYDVNNTPSVGALETFTVPVRVLYSSSFGGGHYCRIEGAQMWPLNKAHFTDVNRWQSQARALVDDIANSGYSTTRPLYIEGSGNEPWNLSGVFAPDWAFARGIGTAHKTDWEAWQTANGKSGVEEEFGGAGVVSAYLRYYVEQELANRSLTYNLKWVQSTQTANEAYARAMTQGHLYVLDDVFGYTAQQQTDAMANHYCAGTSYTNQVLQDVNAGNNITGLTGSAHDTEILDRFDGTAPGYNADSTGLAADIVSWMTGPTIKSQNNAWVVDRHNICKAAAEAQGGNWFGDYEGGDHSQSFNIPSGVWNSVRTNSAGQTFSEWWVDTFQRSNDRATIVADLYDRRIANALDDIISQYGGFYGRTSGEPWGQGTLFEALLADIAKIHEYGRLA